MAFLPAAACGVYALNRLVRPAAPASATATGAAAAITAADAATGPDNTAAAPAAAGTETAARDPFTDISLRAVLLFSLPLVLTQLVGYGVRQQETLILAWFLPAAQVGIYNAGLKTAVLVSFIQQATSAIQSPVLAQLHETGQLQALRTMYRTVARWCFTVALPMFAGSVLFGREILAAWGGEFAGAYPVLVLLAAGQLVNVATGAAGSVLIMGARQKVELTNTVIALVLGFALDVLLIPRWGIVGAAIAASASLTAVNLLRVVQVHRLWGANPFGADYLKPLLAGAVAFAATLGFKAWLAASTGAGPLPALLIGLPLMTALYVGGLWWAGFDAEDRDVARSLAGRVTSSRARRARGEPARSA
ncbi:MAG: polysaccharide biosynthesis C-terminal domain-containing protein [Gemmatimonadetes bacterium]|nr:polysaccharide biosynthesis C-terminal domain-containing protein [Gemmatimonadota bacterium]